MKTESTRVIDAADIAAIVAAEGVPRLFDLVISKLDEITGEFNNHKVDLKTRDGFVVTQPYDGLLEWMPATRFGASAAVKMVAYNPHNPEKHGLPTILSTLYGFDVADGHLRCVVDGTFTTALRTGAASALASRLLARPDASVLGLVGCGAQAVTQLHALQRVFNFERVLLFDIDPAVEASFASRARVNPSWASPVSRAELEAEADIICTATSVAPADDPVIAGDNVKPDVHINAIGSDMPGKVELPLSLLRKSTVCPDYAPQARAEGECQQLTSSEEGPSLFELQADRAASQRLVGTRTVYDSTGLALQDLAMIELFEELAHRHGRGQDVMIEANSGDPLDPYAFMKGRDVDVALNQEK